MSLPWGKVALGVGGGLWGLAAKNKPTALSAEVENLGFSTPYRSSSEEKGLERTGAGAAGALKGFAARVLRNKLILGL